jgi:acetyl esterase
MGLDVVRYAVENAPLPEMPEMASIEDCAAPGPAGPVPLRIYHPSAQTASPVLMYFHGGGMVLGSNHSFEPLARTLAALSGAAVVSVDYRLAPECPPPAQFDDAYSATAWVAENADRLGVDAERLAVVGDSAGGSLAAAVALAARDHDGPAILCQVLLYPGLDRDMGAPSIAALADAPMLSHDDICYMHDLADQGANAPHDPYRIPAYARDLGRLPQTIIVTAECDPIRDWGERYAIRLRDAGVQVSLCRYPGAAHGFLMHAYATARGRLAIAEVCALLRAKFGHPLHFSDVPITGHNGSTNV